MKWIFLNSSPPLLLSPSCPTPTSAIDQELSAVFNWLDEVDCPCRQREARRGIGVPGMCVCVCVCVCASQWKCWDPFRLLLRAITVMKWKSVVQKTTDPLINWQVKETNNLKHSFLLVFSYWPDWKNVLFFCLMPRSDLTISARWKPDRNYAGRQVGSETVNEFQVRQLIVSFISVS